MNPKLSSPGLDGKTTCHQVCAFGRMDEAVSGRKPLQDYGVDSLLIRLTACGFKCRVDDIIEIKGYTKSCRN